MLYNLNFNLLEVVSRYRDPQIQIGKKIVTCVQYESKHNVNLVNARIIKGLKTAIDFHH